MVERFGPIEDIVVPGEGEAGGRPVTVTNPLSSQHSVMRQSLIGSLLEVIGTNVRQGRQDVAIFEIGKGYGATEDGDSTHEWWRLGVALTGAAEIPAWNRPARPYDLDDAKGVIELIARATRAAATGLLAADRRPDGCIPAVPPASRQATSSPAMSGSCTRPTSKPSTCGPPHASSSPSWRSPGCPVANRACPGRRPCRAIRRSTATSR